MTFDIRMRKQLYYYNGHEQRFSEFDFGENYNEHLAVSAGQNSCKQSEMLIWDLRLSPKDQPSSQGFMCAGAVIIQKIKFWNDKILWSDKTSEIGISSFGEFKNERWGMNSNISIRS